MAAFFDQEFDPGQSVQNAVQEIAKKSGLSESLVRGLVSSEDVPQTRTRLSHAFTVRTRSNRVIGACYEFNQNMGLQIDDEYEIDVNAHGLPAEMIPQSLTTRDVRLARIDLYTEIFEEVFYAGFELEDLTQQRVPFRLREAWREPAIRRIYEYFPCYIQTMSRDLSATNDRVVRVVGAVRWGRRTKVLGR